MIQLYAYKDGVRYELDTYAQEPIKLTISAEDITDIPKVESTFSRQFRIPATNNNSKFFNYWYELDVVDFDITQKVKAEIYVDGLFFKSGELRLNAAYNNNDSDNIDLEVVFFGETRDFASEVGDIFLNALNVSDVDHILTHDLMHQTQTEPPTALEGKLRYGLAIRGYEYDADGNFVVIPGFQNGQITFDNQEQRPFINQQKHIEPKQYVPFFQLKYLIDKIFDRTSYGYSDDSIFNEQWFASLYTEGISKPSAYVPTTEGTVEATGRLQQLGTNEERVNFNEIITDTTNSFSLSTDEYTVGVDGDYAFEVSADAFDYHTDFGALTVFNLRLYVNNVVVDNQVSSVSASKITLTVNYDTTDPGNSPLSIGDKVYATIEISGEDERPQLSNMVFSCLNAPDAVFGATLLKSDVTILDFFKSVLNRFRLVMVPSKVKPNEFIIRPWKDYITDGDFFDWTHKLDNNKDIVIKPTFFNQSAIVKFEDLEDIDKYNQLHIDEYNYIYGRKLYDSQNELLKDVREIENIFAPTPVATVLGSESELNPMVIPVFAKEIPEVDVNGYSKLVPHITKPRILFYNGLQPTTLGFYDQGPGSGVLHNVYAQFTPYEEFFTRTVATDPFGPGVDTLDLNWGKDIRFFNPTNTDGITVYDAYWSEYIESLYNPNARIITAYFKLNAEDLRNLTFDDVIFIKNGYYRIQKVYDAPLNDEAVVKVDLVKLLNYKPS